MALQHVMSGKKIPKNLELETLFWQSGLSRIAGVDEAGCGPLAGPVVAAAVIFPPYAHIAEVKDSKKLTAKKREELYSIIVDSAISFGIGIVPPEEIDRINIRQATFKAMRKAIGNLKTQPDYVLFDGYELPEKLLSQEAVINGDDHSFTIAAASILAKVSRDRLMLDWHDKYPIYGFNRHKGYGTEYHRTMLAKYGPCEIHRRSFLSKIIPQF
ncbi:MAG: ribonuclease HII [Calditrichia bacterium]